MITGILFQVLQLHRLCKFAKAPTVLVAILPAIDSEQYFNDKLADTQDAIYDGRIGNLGPLFTHKRFRYSLTCLLILPLHTFQEVEGWGKIKPN